MWKLMTKLSHILQKLHFYIQGLYIIILLILILRILKIYYILFFFSNIITTIEFFEIEKSKYITLGFGTLLYGNIFVEIILDNELTGIIMDFDGNIKSFWNFTISDNFGFMEFQNGTGDIVIK